MDSNNTEEEMSGTRSPIGSLTPVKIVWIITLVAASLNVVVFSVKSIVGKGPLDMAANSAFACAVFIAIYIYARSVESILK